MIHKNIIDPTHDFSDIAQLYADCFGTGDAAQLTDPEETKAYFQWAVSNGGTCRTYSENDKTIAALLHFPAQFHTHYPPAIAHLTGHNCIYIAELMVHTHYRGRGLANQLLRETLAEFPYRDFLIRVWKENRAALHLYLKTGFTEVATITETKTKPDGKTLFEMEKVYLHKNYIP